jgi:hypothetical protein
MDNTHTYLRGRGRAKWEKVKQLTGGCMGTLSVMRTPIATKRGLQRLVVKELTKKHPWERSDNYQRELLTLIKLKDVSGERSP